MSYIPVAETLRMRGQLALALEVCQQGIHTGRGTIAGHILLAKIHFDMGKYDLAEKECENVLFQAPHSTSARKLQIQTALKRRLYVHALELLEQNASAADDPDLVSAFVEAQRGLAESFMRELMSVTNVPGVSPASKHSSREDLFKQLRARPEVVEYEEIGAKDTESQWAQMVRLWEAHCHSAGTGGVHLGILETAKGSVFIRDLGEGAGTLVVTLARSAPVGPVKRLADLLAAKNKPHADGTPHDHR